MKIRTFSELIEDINKALSDEASEFLATKAADILSKDVEYMGEGQFGVSSKKSVPEARGITELMDKLETATSKRLVVPLSVSHEYGDFEYGVVELSPALAARIKTLAESVRTLGIYKIEEFNYQLEPMRVDYEAEESEDGKVVLTTTEAHSDCNCLCVTDTEFFWIGNFKNISDYWSCEAIPLSVLDEAGDYDLRPAF